MPSGNKIFQEKFLQNLWNQGCDEDKNFNKNYISLHQNERTFPKELGLKISISECDFDERGALRY